ncbi:MAG: hypothetical protein Q9192_002266 [Flavoplaca navasiana]
MSDRHSLSNIKKDNNWSRFHSREGYTAFRPHVDVNALGPAQSFSARSVEIQASDPNKRQSEDDPDHHDNDANTESRSPVIESIESTVFDPGTSNIGDLSSCFGDSQPEILNPAPRRVDFAFSQANARHFRGYLPIHNATSGGQYPSDLNRHFFNKDPLPAPASPTRTPSTTLTTWPPSPPSPAPTLPTRQILRAPFSHPSPHSFPSFPQSRPPPADPPSYIVPASSQLIFNTVASEIAKASTSKRREHDFEFPKGRRCFGLALAPSRRVVKKEGKGKKRRTEGRRKQGVAEGRNPVQVKGDRA